MNGSRSARALLLVGVKAAHTAIWFTVEAAVAYLLVSGIAGRSGPRQAIAAGVVAAETAVFLGNGAHCPLTGVAESLGAERGSVTDIYLPRPVARSLPVIHAPVLGLIVWLHWRNLRGRRGPRASSGNRRRIVA